VNLHVAIGVDVVEIERLHTALGRTPSLAQRIFTEAELAAARGRVASLAGRFAAKEATMKALGVGLGAVPLRAIEVATEPSGAPRLVLASEADTLARARGWRQVSLSIAHERSVAVAMVVAMCERPGEP